MTLSAGTRLGPYEGLSPLGTGGMGEVYRARDGRLDRPVAIRSATSSSASGSHGSNGKFVKGLKLDYFDCSSQNS